MLTRRCHESKPMSPTPVQILLPFLERSLYAALKREGVDTPRKTWQRLTADMATLIDTVGGYGNLSPAMQWEAQKLNTLADNDYSRSRRFDTTPVCFAPPKAPNPLLARVPVPPFFAPEKLKADTLQGAFAQTSTPAVDATQNAPDAFIQSNPHPPARHPLRRAIVSS